MNSDERKRYRSDPIDRHWEIVSESTALHLRISKGERSRSFDTREVLDTFTYLSKKLLRLQIDTRGQQHDEGILASDSDQKTTGQSKNINARPKRFQAKYANRVRFRNN